MNESLNAACGEFEQIVLCGILKTAAFTKTAPKDPDDESNDFGSSGSADAFSQLITEALAGAVERAGGIGLRKSLLSALQRDRP